MKKAVIIMFGILIALKSPIEPAAGTLVNIPANTISDELLSKLSLLYNATPCSDQSLLKKFSAMQKEIGLTEKMSLFQMNDPKNVSRLACYFIQLQTICIYIPNFSKLPPIAKSFCLYHELRHHLQFTTEKAANRVKEYMKSKNMSHDQALEYDADIFALKHCLQSTKCKLCLQDIMNIRYFSDVKKKFDEKGYITVQKIQASIKKYPKGQFCSICSYHKNTHNALN